MKVHDIINKIVILSNYILHIIWFGLVTSYEVIYLRLIGVRVGKNCQFNGWCSVFRCERSTITIGNENHFNSSGYTNHVGLNHRCILTTMSPNSIIRIGDKCGMSSSSITSFKSITIGNNVRVGANCVIMDGDFHLEDPRVAPPANVCIKDNVWLGYGVIVMKGVTIGENSIVAANSVVVKDIPANVVAAGNPAKPIKEIR